MEDDRVEENYQNWKKNTPFLYDAEYTTLLDFPALTLAWFPKRVVDGPMTTHRVVLGTHAPLGEQSQLLLTTVRLQTVLADADMEPLEEPREKGAPAVSYSMRINHPTEVNRVRLNPHNQYLIATRTSLGGVLVFDYTKHPSTPVGEESRPEITFDGHTAEGYALEWSRTEPDVLASGGNDKHVCVWNMSGGTQPVCRFAASSDVEGVSFHDSDANVLAAAAGKQLQLWDVRAGTGAPKALAELAENATSVDCSPKSPFLVLCAAGSVVTVHDIRKLEQPLATQKEADGQVLTAQWSPWCETIFGASGKDTFVRLYDLGRDTPPFFRHGGHRHGVSEFAFSPEERTVISVDEGNFLHAWSPSTCSFLD
jgi:histone-binding protein RBBP4